MSPADRGGGDHGGVGYSLTDASALGLDLARTPGGVGAAGVLLRGLLGPLDDLVPARAPADLAVARARAVALLGPPAPTVVDLTGVGSGAGSGAGSGVGSGVGSGPASGERVPGDRAAVLRSRKLLRRLGAVHLGTVDDLLALAADLPRLAPASTSAWPGEGSALAVVEALEADRGEVLADAVLAALVRDRPDPAAPVLARALEHRLDPPAPERAGLPPLPPPGRALLADSSPVAVATAGLLRRIAATPDAARTLSATGPAPDVWAEHMHEAAWAVATTGRTRLAAAAQLELLRCLDAAGVDGAACVGGAWNPCSAAVQAHVVADVLGSHSWTELTADLMAVLPA